MANKAISTYDSKVTPVLADKLLGSNSENSNETANFTLEGIKEAIVSVDSVNSKTGSVLLTTGDLTEDTDKNYVTDAEKTVIGNTSGVNTGDQDLSTLALKSNVLELNNTTSFTPDADYEPATKKYVDDNAGSNSPLTTKGDLYTYDTDNVRLGVGSDGQVLKADSSEDTGLKWADESGGDQSELEAFIFMLSM